MISQKKNSDFKCAKTNMHWKNKNFDDKSAEKKDLNQFNKNKCCR